MKSNTLQILLKCENSKNTLNLQFQLLLKEKLTNIEYKLNKLINTPRAKRSLIDGLGNVIRFITGNLDQSDLNNINNNIKLLTENQVNLSKRVSQTATLFSKISDKFYDSLEILKTNQNHIVSIIDTYNNQFEQLFFLQQQKDSLETFENHIDILTRTVTFTNIEMPNLEIISFKELQEIQNELLIDYNRDMLVFYDKTHPFEILQNSRLGIIAINNLLVMALKVPILNPIQYNISKIYPTPNQKHISLVPPAKYYLENRLENRWTDSCQSTISIYICQNLVNSHCLLNKQTTCEFAETKNSEAYKLISSGILTIFSEPKEVIEKCQNIISRHTLHLNNIINSECSVIIDNNLINTYNSNITINLDDGQKLPLPKPTYKLRLLSSHLDKITSLKEDLQSH